MSHTIRQRLQKLGLALPEILLPAFGKSPAEWQKWAVIACDQYTSEPEYWRELRRAIGAAPSVLQAILPEAEIPQQPEKLAEQLQTIQANMRALLAGPLLKSLGSQLVLVRRAMNSGREQWGLVIAVDLECYQLDHKARIRSTEKTVPERVPVRQALRAKACLDFSHVLLLCNVPQLLEPLVVLARSGQLPVAYDFPLYGSAHGSVCGYLVAEALVENFLLPALEREDPVFWVGDGNHSLLAAKQIWEDCKGQCSATDPRRFALVELLDFAQLPLEPIHRLLVLPPSERAMDCLPKLLRAMENYSKAQVRERPDLAASSDLLENTLRQTCPDRSQWFFLFCCEGRIWQVSGYSSRARESVRVVQQALDSLGGWNLDYIHGAQRCQNLATSRGAALLLPYLSRERFFHDLAQHQVLPRKSFSIGHSEEKRFYIECRKLV